MLAPEEANPCGVIRDDFKVTIAVASELHGMHGQSRASGRCRMQMKDGDQQSGLGSGRHNTLRHHRLHMQ